MKNDIKKLVLLIIAIVGVTRDNGLGTNRMTFFAAVLSDEEGQQLDLQAYKTTAFFGNALKGFGQ
jgi:hypothetical protein